MTYWSLSYLIGFLPVVIILYNLFPKKYRWCILLIASYGFIWSISNKLILYIIATTILTYLGGLWINKIQSNRDIALKDVEKEKKKEIKGQYLKKQKRVAVLLSLVVLAVLVVLKYSGFFIENVDNLLSLLKVDFQFEIPKFVMPIGISFYTLQVISYFVDVYKEKFKADKNLGRVALWIAFFPQIMEGPICRYQQTAEQLWKGERTNYKNLTFGAQRILFGMAKKLLIVDRVNAFLVEVFNNYGNYDGGIVAVAMFMYTLQLYMDFSGSMDVVIGTAQIFGIELPENFKQPFFSKNISDFWTRWHITLGIWFRDYIFYPVSLTEKCKKITTAARKKIGNYYGPLIASSIALFCVWLSNGLWHGAAWSFIFFGMYHFALILLGKIFNPLFERIIKFLHINPKHFLYQGFQIIRTTLLVCVGELFFRANTLTDGFKMFGKMISEFSFESFKNGIILNIGLDKKDYLLISCFVVLIFIISILKEKGINVREFVAKRNVVIRWGIYYVLIIGIIVFGAYGLGYVPLDPIYANF